MKTMAVLLTLFALAIAGCKEERIPKPKTADAAHYDSKSRIQDSGFRIQDKTGSVPF
jgi:hypothetical protein